MQKLDVQIPEEVLDLVNVLQRTLGSEFEVTLSGGFLRDSYGNAPIKDIDIMVAPVRGETDVAVIHDIIYDSYIADWFTGRSICNGDYIQGMEARGVQGIIMGECPNLGGFECQLIVYREPIERNAIAADMDINICQVVMGPDGVIWATEAFVYGFQYKLLTILNGQSDKREAERIERMLAKYPDFKVTNRTVSDLGE